MKIKIVSPILLLGMLFFSSCVKNYIGTNTRDISSAVPNVLITEGGLYQFGTSSLTFPGTDAFDTTFFHLEYAANNVASKDMVLKVAYDANALASYNSTQPATEQFAKFPDSIYSFTTSTVTIKAGQNYSSAIPFVVYPSKIDGSKNYMFPISITDGGGTQISSNISTIYYHLIGNPIAGAYNSEWIRYNTATATGTPYADVTSTATFSPVNATEITVPSGTGVTYILDFTNTNGALSKFTLKFDAASVTAAGITITGGPTIVTADPVAHKYEFNFTYNNSAGAARNITDKFSQ